MDSVLLDAQTAPAPDLRVPQQGRSRRSMNRMLAAAEQLLDEGALENATVELIVDRAGTSVGAFYARFRNKDALFRSLQIRSLEHTREVFLAVLLGRDWGELMLREFVQALLATTASHYRRHQGVLRTLSLQARLGDKTWVTSESERLNTEIYRMTVGALLCWRHAIGAEEPEKAIRLAITVAAATLREVIVYARRGLSPVDIDDSELVAQLVDVFLLCLDSDGDAVCDRTAAKALNRGLNP